MRVSTIIWIESYNSTGRPFDEMVPDVFTIQEIALDSKQQSASSSPCQSKADTRGRRKYYAATIHPQSAHIFIPKKPAPPQPPKAPLTIPQQPQIPTQPHNRHHPHPPPSQLPHRDQPALPPPSLIAPPQIDFIPLISPLIIFIPSLAVSIRMLLDAPIHIPSSRQRIPLKRARAPRSIRIRAHREPALGGVG